MVTLWVVEGNDQARRIYWRQGFRRDGSTKTTRMSAAEAIEVRYRMSLRQRSHVRSDERIGTGVSIQVTGVSIQVEVFKR
jgi:hypothetical protein